MNHFDIKNYIAIYNNAIPLSICASLVNESKDFYWDEFTWSSVSYRQVIEAPKNSPQCDTFENVPAKYKLLIHPIIEKLIENYKNSYVSNLQVMGFSPIKLNRYNVGYNLEKHWDNIHTLFDGQRKGIPTLSLVGLLNEDFEGGNFVFWDDHTIPLKTGSVIIFPSTFLYSHRITKVLEGTRYSFVSWVW